MIKLQKKKEKRKKTMIKDEKKVALRKKERKKERKSLQKKEVKENDKLRKNERKIPNSEWLWINNKEREKKDKERKRDYDQRIEREKFLFILLSSHFRIFLRCHYFKKNTLYSGIFVNT